MLRWRLPAREGGWEKPGEWVRAGDATLAAGLGSLGRGLRGCVQSTAAESPTASPMRSRCLMGRRTYHHFAAKVRVRRRRCNWSAGGQPWTRNCAGTFAVSSQGSW